MSVIAYLMRLEREELAENFGLIRDADVDAPVAREQALLLLGTVMRACRSVEASRWWRRSSGTRGRVLRSILTATSWSISRDPSRSAR